MFDFSALIGKFTEAGFTRQTFAKELGISKNSMTNKLSGNYPFKVDEIAKACDVLDISSGEIGRYFFTEKVEVSKQIR